MTDALKLVEDRVFNLDTDFDLLIDPQRVHILRPSGFEFAGQLQGAILDAVPKNRTSRQPRRTSDSSSSEVSRSTPASTRVRLAIWPRFERRRRRIA